METIHDKPNKPVEPNKNTSVFDVNKKYDFCTETLIPVIKNAVARCIDGKLDIAMKGHGNFVTNIDIRIEEYLKENLSRLIPGSGFIAEESGAVKNGHEYCWVIDPIDGTSNMIFGFVFTVSVALLHCSTDEVVLGVVYVPREDVVYFAGKDAGSFRLNRDGSRNVLHVGHFRENEGVAIFGMPYDRTKAHRILELAEHYYATASDMKRIGPSSLDICLVAAGFAKLYFELDLNLWDIAAGELILTEAGGHVKREGDLTVFYAEEDGL